MVAKSGCAVAARLRGKYDKKSTNNNTLNVELYTAMTRSHQPWNSYKSSHSSLMALLKTDVGVKVLDTFNMPLLPLPEPYTDRGK